MIYGKIDYLNLLPFHIFMKKRLRHSAQKMAWSHHAGSPAAMNRLFAQKRIDAAVVSSIISRRLPCSDFGIIADKKVMSVLLVPGPHRPDSDSATSNALAKALGLSGRVIIGDKALRYYLEGHKDTIDMAGAWHDATGLPFVFGRLCCSHKGRHCTKAVRRLSRDFFRHPPKIPRYLLIQAADKRGMAPEQITTYLKYIYYRIGWREKKALKKFFMLTT